MEKSSNLYIILQKKFQTPIERHDSNASDVDISHKPFAQRRLQIIKQLEAQNSAHLKRAENATNKPSNANSTGGWQQYNNGANQRNYEVTLLVLLLFFFFFF